MLPNSAPLSHAPDLVARLRPGPEALRQLSARSTGPGPPGRAVTAGGLVVAQAQCRQLEVRLHDNKLTVRLNAVALAVAVTPQEP